MSTEPHRTEPQQAGPEQAGSAQPPARRRRSWGCSDARYAALLDLYRRGTTAAGHAITSRELRVLYPQEIAAWPERALACDTNALYRRKRLLERVGRRKGTWAFVPKDADPTLFTVGVSPDAEVLAALRAGYAAQGRPLLASEVQALRPPPRTALDNGSLTETLSLLLRLTDPTFVEAGVAPVARLCFRDPSGAVVSFFAPAELVAPEFAAAVRVVDRSEGRRRWNSLEKRFMTPEDVASLPLLAEQPWGLAFLPWRQLLIALAERVRGALGLPPSHKEGDWYLAAHPQDEIVLELRRRRPRMPPWGAALAFTERRQSGGLSNCRGLEHLRTPLTCPTSSAAAPRVGMAPFSPRDRQLVHAHDTLLVRRPGAEWGGIEELERDPGSTAGRGARAVALLCAARRRAVVQALAEAAPLEEWPALLPVLDATCDRREAWLDAASPAGRREGIARNDLVRDLRSEVHDLTSALVDPRFVAAAGGSAMGVTIIDRASGLNEAGWRWLAGVLQNPSSRIHRRPRLVPRVAPGEPRVRVVTVGGRRKTEVVPSAPDRVDVLLAAVQEAGGPAAEVLVLEAVTTLGLTLRDRVVLREAYEVARADGALDLARAILVARGMLGEPLDLPGLILDQRQPEDLQAAVLATLLARLGDARVAFTDAIRVVRHPRVASALTAAVGAIDAGEPFRVIDGW